MSSTGLQKTLHLRSCESSHLQNAWKLWLGAHQSPRPRQHCCTGRGWRTVCSAEQPQQEPPQRQLQPQQQGQRRPFTPPAHRIYKGTAGSPTSYPIRPPGYKPGQPPDPDDDGYEWVKVGPNYQIPNPELGPLERRVSTSFLEGMLSDNVNLEETAYWFTEPSGGWNQGDRWERAAKRTRTNTRQNARNAGPGRLDISHLAPGQRLRGMISALWLYEGIQVDIGCQWDGLVAIHHEQWETIKFDLRVGQEVIVDVCRIITVPRCKFPLQLLLVEPENMVPLMMDPEKYEFPFDLEDLKTVEEREAATGLSWQPEASRATFVTPEQTEAARELLSLEHAAAFKKERDEERQAEMDRRAAAGRRHRRRQQRVPQEDYPGYLEQADREVMYMWGQM